MNLIPDKLSQVANEENKNLNLSGISGILPDGLINKLIARKKNSVY